MKYSFLESIHLKEKHFLLLVISINLILKALTASFIELGNDEVYYWTYALFPDWSHFDHPPMVGLTIQLFTLNLKFNSELFLRLGSLVLSSINIVLLFNLVKKIYSAGAAYFSTLLFTASVYFNIICGLFILPDTPQLFFVLLALTFGIPAITTKNYSKKDSFHIIFFGLFTGLAFLSKYHSLFLWFGFGLYILLHARDWLKKPSLYISVLVTILLMTPVIYWNANNDFISFTFHESRIGFFNHPIRFNTFLQFNLGQFFYQNPVLSVIYLLTLISVFRKGTEQMSASEKLLLYLSVPLMLIFTFTSIFKSTLPHWTGPAFIGLLILSSQWLNERMITYRKRVVYAILSANAIVLLVLVLGVTQINYGLLYSAQKGQDPKKLGKNDVTLDMYGWHQAKTKFQQFLQREGIEQADYAKVKIISNNWFPAAHIDYYIANPLKIDLFVFGAMEKMHKYYWINQDRKFNTTDKLYYITSSQHFSDPYKLSELKGKIIPRDTLLIERNGETVKNLFLFEISEVKNLNQQ